MDSGLREILRAHEYNRLNLGCYGCNWSFDDMEDGNSWDQYLAHIESLESQQPKTRGKGMEHFPVPDGAEQAILPPHPRVACGQGDEMSEKLSEKLSERMNRDGGHSTVYVPEVAALEQQLAEKDAEIARLRSPQWIAVVDQEPPLGSICNKPENRYVRVKVGRLLTKTEELAESGEDGRLQSETTSVASAELPQFKSQPEAK